VGFDQGQPTGAIKNIATGHDPTQVPAISSHFGSVFSIEVKNRRNDTISERVYNFGGTSWGN
jgi:hypothetical protein